MRDIITRLSKHSFIYGMGSMAVLLPGFILVPLYTRYLAPAEYGVLSILTIFMGILSYVYELGMVGALTRQYYEHDSAAARKTVVSTAFLFLLGWTVVLTAVLMIFSPYLDRVLFGRGGAFADLVRVALWSACFSSFIYVPQTILRLEERSLAFVAMSGLRIVLTCIFTVTYLVFFRKGLGGVVFSMALAAFVSVIAYIAFTYSRISLTAFSLPDMREMLKFGMAFFPAALLSWVIDYSNRYILSLFADMGQVGIYSLGQKISQVLMIIVKAFYMAWVPIMFSIAAREDAKKIFSSIFTYFMLLLSFLTLGLCVFSKEIVGVVASPAYLDAFKVIPVMSLAVACYGIYIYFMTGLTVVKKVLNQPFILAFGACANVALNIFFIKRMGMMGAAVAVLASYALVALLTYLVSNRYYRIDYEFSRLGKIAVSFAVVYAASLGVKAYFTGMNPWILNAISVAAFPAALYLAGFFKGSETKWLKDIFAR